MTRSMLVVALASALVAGCSNAGGPQSGAAANQSQATGTAPAASGAAASAPATTAAPTSPPAAASSAPAAAPATPPPPPEPKFREVTIPAETTLLVTLVTPLGSKTSKVEDQVKGTLAKPIVVSGTTVVPAGAEVFGSVTEAKESGRVKGRASITMRLNRLTVRGESHQIQTAQIAIEAGSSTKSDAKKGAVGAGAGAIVGGIAGGGSGAAIGGVVGGAGTVLATKGKEVELPAGTMLSTRLLEPVKVMVPNSER
jgi:hypothetical protein